MGEYGNLDWRDIASLISRTDDYAWKLYESDPLRRSYILEAIEYLQLPAGSRGLDAGCGIGLQTMLLADAVGPDGHLTGVDISRPFLNYGRAIAQKAGYAQRIAFEEGDIYKLPFEDGVFDWLWSADCAGYGTRKPLPLLQELARVVKPGGMVAILVYSSQQLLPGYPVLEAHLNATASGIAPFNRDMAPEAHYMRALDWLEDTGLEEPLARTFVAEFQAPLAPEVRTALLALVEMRWPDVRSDLAPGEWELFERLTRPGSPELILDTQGYYAFFTETLFRGRVPA
ncbi:MAG: methyltransferase domain-containing protein [Actinobacteria bacterium]|nr:MAG: methyltransferase domain-containing protein [Actinomycetota bacterium]